VKRRDDCFITPPRYQYLHAAQGAANNTPEACGRQRRGAINGDCAPASTPRGFARDLDLFIATPEGTEYFFHNSACTSTPFDSLREGDAVTFTVGQGPKGPRAENVRPA